MPNNRSLDAADLRQRIRSRSAKCGVVGLGMVGSTQATLIANAGFNVVGYDVDESAVASALAFASKNTDDSSTGQFIDASTSDEIINCADVIFVCVRVNLSADGTPQLDALRAVNATIQANPRGPSLVVLVTTVPVGTTKWFAHQLRCDDNNWFVAFAPERIASHQPLDEVVKTPRLVAGVDKDANDLAFEMMTTLGHEVVPAACPEVCEMSKLLENTFRTQCIALIGEITRAAHAWGIDAMDVCEAAATKPFGYFPFYPGPGVGGHCLQNDLRLLQASCDPLAEPSSLLYAVRDAIAKIPSTTVNRISTLLPIPLAEATILVVGVGFKPGSDDITQSPAASVIECLLAQGAKVRFVDRFVNRFQVNDSVIDFVTASELPTQSYDAILIVAGDSSITLEQLYESSDIVLDTGGARIMAGNSSRLARL